MNIKHEISMTQSWCKLEEFFKLKGIIQVWSNGWQRPFSRADINEIAYILRIKSSFPASFAQLQENQAPNIRRREN